MRLFLYGTLRYRPLLDLVLGHDRAAPVRARLPGFAARWVAGEAYPMIVEEPDAVAMGLVVEVTPEGRARLDFYEGGFGYGTRVVVLEDGSEAEIYWPDPGLAPAAPFDLDDWVRDWGEISLRAASEAMALYGDWSAVQVARVLPAWRARAQAQLSAHHPGPTRRRSPPGAARPETQRTGGYRGFFRLDRVNVAFDGFDGHRIGPLDREIFVAFDAALVLPWDPATDEVLIIEQFRFGPLMREDPVTRVFEPIAGLVDAGETPEDAARREAAEEAGLRIDEVLPMGQGYASPGYSTEYFHFFLARCDLAGAHGHVGGTASESESIRSHVLPLDEALDLVGTGEINATPLAFMLLWLDRHRRAGRDGD